LETAVTMASINEFHLRID
jgi:hypothetical protein